MKGKRLIQMMCDTSTDFSVMMTRKGMNHKIKNHVKYNKVPYTLEGTNTITKLIQEYLDKGKYVKFVSDPQ